MTPAGRIIADEIADRGPMTFHRFMELALYHPSAGYYARRSAGPGLTSDYVTSPELHAAFGGLVCAQLVEMWERLDCPDPFWLVEGGPGTGAFAADVLACAHAIFPEFAEALRVGLVEVSSTLLSVQRARLARWQDRVQWLPPSEGWAAPLGVGCIFANELLDALPVHRVVGRSVGLRERFVDLDGDRFEEIDQPLSTPLMAAQIAAGSARLAPGQLGEVNLAAPGWVREALGLIDRGYALIMDYGEPADVLYGPSHPRGTLRCYWQQTLNEDPFARIGEQDITAHVDLSAIVRGAALAGAGLIGVTTQTSFLGRLGIGTVVERAKARSLPREALWAHGSALDALVDVRGLGRIKVLLFGKRVGGELSGFSRETGNEWMGEAVAGWVLAETPRLLVGSRTVRGGNPT